MSLYNIRRATEGYMINKFNDDLELESSYPMIIVNGTITCHCPAGQRPSCRHRDMLYQIMERVNTAWFLDFDTRAWVDPTGEARETEEKIIEDETEIEEMESALSEPEPTIARSKNLPEDADVAEEFAKLLSDTGQNVLESSPAPEPITRQPDSHPFRRRM